MAKIYFTENNQEWCSESLGRTLSGLPKDMRTKILAYKDWRDRQSRILAKIMLVKLLEYFKLDLTLADMKYAAFNKPYFNSNFHFSSAHSGDIAMCAGTVNGEIGIDIEQIMPVELEDYREQLTPAEWEYINNATDTQKAFFHIWTRKEALLKALGRGTDLEMNKLEALPDILAYMGQTYRLYPLSVAEGYVAHLASSAPWDRESIALESLPGLSHTHEK